MHIVIVNKKYCYANECVWDGEHKKYRNPGKCIGRIDIKGSKSEFVPNKYMLQILSLYATDKETLSKYELLIADTAIAKYGDGIIRTTSAAASTNAEFQTARAVFYGPQLVFGAITKRYNMQSYLESAFPNQVALDILSLTWYIAAEGSALTNSDSWLGYYENPRGSAMSSQDISRLLDRMTTDEMMGFYKLWLTSNSSSQDNDRVLYDITSISYYGDTINAAERGYNSDGENLSQVKLALLCKRKTGMPLFTWTVNGSISDMNTLGDTLRMMEKLGYMPNCLMMDRGFGSKDNIFYMLQKGYIFLQALRLNADWIRNLIDEGGDERSSPDSMITDDGRTYYASTVKCIWALIRLNPGKKTEREDIRVVPYKNKKQMATWQPDGENAVVVEKYICSFYALFCQDLVGSQRDQFMASLKSEHERLVSDENAVVKKEHAKFFVIDKPKYARHRIVEYNIDTIKLNENKYVGYVCFLSNDRYISTAQDALSEYSTRDYIEKDFDEMKNDLDMRRIRVHADQRMKARLFIQFLAEIYIREIRTRLHASELCSKMTKRQIFSHIKTIYMIKFKGKYRDIFPSLSKSQRSILEALGINANH